MSAYSTSESEPGSSLKPKLRTRPIAASLILFGGFIAIIFGIAFCISFGASDISLSTVWEAVFHYNPDIPQHLVIHELRLPRVLASAMVGASFAVAGALMQGMTRNPMADSGLLGLNAGAAFVMALSFAFFPGLSFIGLILCSFLGAAIGAGLVFGFSAFSKAGVTPVRLVLAGSAVSALLAALSEGVALYYNIGQDLAFWYAGGVAGTTWLQLKALLPWIGCALIAAIGLSRSITLLSLGEEIATGLGQRTGLVKLAAMIIVLILAGSSVAVVGAVSFVGLIVPHVTRFLVGVDYRWIIPCSAILGSLLVVFADLAARTINPPYEAPIGALIALIGVPFFLYLARNERRSL
ncbi:iron complex transport system permease protein [Fontibacillus solani]|uniref:Iron complex transport system permease protein n=1 Tax=Fontibacillus solani TaxID=1572857 RepID=A0A7W3SYH3_9BACL|nr:iron ABC transporter permease [Fontibacillus solani]MBA9088545.1 iron complex transport system permease protein [Fontibacillus solani]